MSEQRVEAASVQNLEGVQPIDNDDIINVSSLDFSDNDRCDDIISVSSLDLSDNDRWLYVPTECPPECAVQNLHTWLRSEPEFCSIDNETSNGVRRSIDTRTFTRPKKRTNRTSFESIMEALAPPVPNVWRTQAPALSGIHLHVDKEHSSTNSRRESVPAMLRPISSMVTGLLSNNTISITSGQESMDAFLNMSQSKGIDSFINLTEPDFTDTLMNVSQPSDLNSSILSMPRDDSLHIDNQEELDDPQILTDSMMQTSMFGEVADLKNFNETFSKVSGNSTVIENRSNSGSPVNKTFTSDFQAPEKAELNSTFNTFTRRSVTTPRQSLPLDTELQKRDATFTSSPLMDKSDFDKTLVRSQYKGNKITNSLNNTFESYNPRLGTMDVTVDIKGDFPEHKSDANTDVDTDFESEERKCNNTSTMAHGYILNSTYNEPTDLRRELLQQVHRSPAKKLDSTYNHIAEDPDIDIPVGNHNSTYNTYRKDPSKAYNKDLDKLMEHEAPDNQFDERKYYTFTKKTNISQAKSEIESKQSPEKLDNTFSKPAPKFQRKLRAPRALSKLPQLFQKSNPNLTSNTLKSIDMRSYSNIPNLRYMKGSQPDIPRNVEGSLVSKLFPLGRLKSGSEQRLMEVGGSVRELQIKGACGSTESIESTQSAHSAPDLDDRLSVCSDSSHNSYSTRTMNIDQLHKIARMQEESLKQISTPKPNRRILENTWVEAEKDMPSPIPKNGTDESGSSCSSPRSIDSTVKTSSPLLSPVGSIQSISTAGNHISDVTCIMAHQPNNTPATKPEMLVRPMKHVGVDNKTRLRPPTNWGATNRPSGVASGIPRPASRIPAPRFARPTFKSNQADWKKGCL